MKLGLQFGYWGAQPPTGVVERIKEAERLGYDIAFTAESWGSDAFSPLAYYAAHTERIRLGTAIVQLAARTPASCAMHTITLDHLSNGRFSLGLGVSGPQVAEGWYGTPFGKPLARTREYVSIIRQALERKGPVVNDGPHYPLPYQGPNGLGLGKPLKPIVHPLRADVPILLGTEGPKNVALTAEIADGWLPIYYGARNAHIWRPWLEEGWARPGARRGPDTFEIIGGSISIVDDVDAEVQKRKPGLGFYIGGMGARDMNFHKDVFSRMGYEAEVQKIQDLFFEGRRDEASAAVPDQLVLDQGIIASSKEQARDELAMWAEAGYTTMLANAPGPDEMRAVAEVVLDA